MSISSETAKTIFTCNNSTVDFDFDFKVFDEADLEVILYTIADGTEEILTLSTDYSTSLLTETGGRITTVDTYSSDYKLIARRKQSLVQELDYTQNDAFSTINLEEQLDKIVMMIQNLKEQVDRAVKFDASIIEAESVIDLPNVEATITSIDINGLTEKTTLVDDDIFIVEDSEADYGQKKVKKSNLVDLDTDGDLTANSDTKIASQKATKTYADTKVVSPATNTANYIPQWNEANSKILKDGVEKSTDGTLTDNSDNAVPTEKAVKTYADTQVATKISKTIAGEIYAMTVKETLADADVLVIEDSAASYAKKKATKGSLIPSTVSHKVVYTTGSGNWTAPAGITTVYVTMCGGGGGGGGTNTSGQAGSGGGSSSWINKRAITVTPTSSYAYSVGAAGAGGVNEANGTAGGDSTFGSTLATTKGGGGGAKAQGAAGVGGGKASGVTGGIGYEGLDGIVGSGNNGGGGAGSPFGQGGDGGVSDDGSAATGYGAGGGGAGGLSTPNTGGAGTGGIIILEY